jgi:hypothetical protein
MCLLVGGNLKDVTHFFDNKWGTYSTTYFSPPEESNTAHPVIVLHMV